MVVVSKFEKFYLLRNVLVPIICIGLSILLLDVKFNYKKDADVIFPIFFLLAFGSLVLLYNLDSIYKIIVDETTISKVYFLSRKTEIISYASIKSLDKEFIDGGSIANVGRISDGYHKYVFNLVNGKKLIVSPLCFNNYNQLIITINQNLKELNNKE
jgi:hypothetical protein